MIARGTGAESLETKGAEELIRWTGEQFGSRAVFACSFGTEDMVLLDLIAKSRPPAGDGIRVLTIDTGRLFSETYSLIQAARRRYSIPIRILVPDGAELGEMISQRGPNHFYESVANRMLCCEIRKVHPLDRALDGVDAWVVGLRREQSSERAGVPKVSPDPAHPRRWKISPLADWSSADVWKYIGTHDVPVNPLHAQGFPSIGCAPCTRAVGPGEDPRNGRWWWETGAKECGLHHPPVSPAPVASPPPITAKRRWSLADIPEWDVIA